MSNTSIFWAYPDPNGPVRPSSTHFFQWNMNDNEYTYWRPHLVMWTIFRRDLKVLQSMAVTYIWDTNDIHWIIHNPVEHWKIYTHHQPVAGCWCNNHLVHTYTLKKCWKPIFHLDPVAVATAASQGILAARQPPVSRKWNQDAQKVEIYQCHGWNLLKFNYKIL